MDAPRLRSMLLAAVFATMLMPLQRPVAHAQPVPAAPAVLREQKVQVAAAIETLLPADTVAYLRWDGLAAHRKSWQQTAAYAALYETSLGEFLARAVEQLMVAIGTAGGESAQIARQVQEVLNHVAQEGLVAAVGQHADNQFSLTVVLPGAASPTKRGTLEGVLAQAFAGPGWKREKLSRAGRQITQATDLLLFKAAWWSEGNDLVFTFGPQGADTAALEVLEGKQPNITQSPLYERYAAAEERTFEQAAVVWVDTARIVERVRNLPVQAHVSAGQIIQALGLDGLKSIALQFGFSGKRLQSVVTIEAPAPRRGILKLVDQKPFTLEQLPPLPPAGGFYAFSLDTAVLYDETLTTVNRVLQLVQPQAVPMVARGIAQLNQVLGFDVRQDVLANLGHVGVITSEGGGMGLAALLLPAIAFGMARAGGPSGGIGIGPAEGIGLMAGMLALGGLGGLNFALVLEVEDAKALQATLAKLDATLTRIAAGRLTITSLPPPLKKGGKGGVGSTIKMYRLDQPGMFLTPTVALTDRWLIIGTYPQPVQATLLRQAGQLPAWQPSPEVREALAGLPGEFTSFTTSDPRPAIAGLLGLLPLGGALADSSAPGVELDVSLIPLPEQVSAHLFPNVSVTVVDARSIRWISRCSLPSLPSLGGGGTIATTGVMAALLLPAVQRAREAARRTQSMSNEKQIALSLIVHHDAHRQLPSGTHPHPKLPPQKRFSWFADLLPYVEQQAAFNSLDFTKSWDDPANRQGASAHVDVWLNAGLPGPQEINGYPATHYLGIAGLGQDAARLPKSDKRAGAFGYDRPLSVADVGDGLSNTIAVMEVSKNVGPWAAGGPSTVRAFTRQPYVDGPDGFGGVYPGGANAAFLDGSVRFLSDKTDSKVLEALSTINGGEPAPNF